MIGKQQKHRQPFCTISAQVGYQVTTYFVPQKKKKKNVTTYLRIKERKNLSNILKIFINKLL